MFKNIKKKLQERIEKNGVKIPSISYMDKDGKERTEDIILKRSNMPLVGDWSRIYPPVNEDGSWNTINFIFGGKKNFIKLLIILGLIAMILFAFSEVFNQYEYLKSVCEPILALNQ